MMVRRDDPTDREGVIRWSTTKNKGGVLRMVEVASAS